MNKFLDKFLASAVTTIFLTWPIMKVPPLTALGSAQRPAVLIAIIILPIFIFIKCRFKSSSKFLLIIFLIFVAISALNNGVGALRPASNILIALYMLTLASAYPAETIRGLICGLFINLFFLGFDLARWLNGLDVLGIGIFAPDTKLSPTGLTPEPSETALLIIALAALLKNYDRKFFSLLILTVGVFYALNIGTATFYILILSYIIANLMVRCEIRLLYSSVILIGSLIALTYFQNSFFDFSIYNDSAHNRLSTPVFLMDYLLREKYHLFFGYGFGGILTNFDEILLSGSNRFSIGLSTEQLAFARSEMAGNIAVFNFYARSMFETGIVGLGVLMTVLFKIYLSGAKVNRLLPKSDVFLFVGLCYWFINDSPINLFIFIGAALRRLAEDRQKTMGYESA